MGIVKDIVDIATDLGRQARKLARTQQGKRAAEKALRHLLIGGREDDKDFLRLVKQLESAEVETVPAELVRKVTAKPAAMKAAPKKPAAKKPAAKRAAPKKSAAKKPTAKKAAPKKSATKKATGRKTASKK